MGKHYAGVAILWIKTAEAALSVGLQEDGIEIYKSAVWCSKYLDEDGSIQDSIIKKIQTFEPNYVYENKSSSRCYIATCVYGSYDCPQVWTLRRYRDYTLAKTWYGRSFINFYYTVSPTIVNLFGQFEWIKSLWKCVLDSMIARLQKNGVEDTPYQDLDW